MKTLFARLEKVERLQKEVQKILSGIERDFPHLAETDGDGWTFAMHIDGNGRIPTAEENLELAKTFQNHDSR